MSNPISYFYEGKSDMSKGIIPRAQITPSDVREYEKMVKAKPADDNAEPADWKAERLASLKATLTAAPGSLWSALYDQERKYLCFLWRIDADELMTYDFDQEVIDRLRPAAKWTDGSPQGFLVTDKTISLAVTVDGVIDIRTIDKGTRLRVGLDCSPEEAEKWVSKGLAKRLSCVTVRALLTGRGGISIPHLRRGELLCIEGSPSERLLLQWLELGYVELVCEGAYRGDLKALRACRLPFKSVRKQRMTQQVVGDHGVIAPRVEYYYDPTGEFASIPAPICATKPDWRETPLVRSVPRKNGSYGGLDFFQGRLLENPVFWTLKLACDPAQRIDGGKSALVILDPLPPAWEAYQPILAKYMTENPGSLSDAPGFPAWPVEAA